MLEKSLKSKIMLWLFNIFVLKLVDPDSGSGRPPNPDPNRIRNTDLYFWNVVECCQEFELHINNNRYRILPPKLETLSSEELRKISDVKYLISELYEALNIQEFQLQKETELQKVILKTNAHFRFFVKS